MLVSLQSQFIEITFAFFYILWIDIKHFFFVLSDTSYLMKHIYAFALTRFNKYLRMCYSLAIVLLNCYFFFLFIFLFCLAGPLTFLEKILSAVLYVYKLRFFFCSSIFCFWFPVVLLFRFPSFLRQNCPFTYPTF